MKSPCDGRIVYTQSPVPVPVTPSEIDSTQEGTETENVDIVAIDDEVPDVTTGTEIGGEEDNGLSGKRNFCGETHGDANANCTREMHCPVSLDYEIVKLLNNRALKFIPRI